MPAVKQLLTIYPALVATLVGFAQPTALTGFIPLYFHLNLNDPRAVYQGVPAGRASGASPTDTSEASTPSGLYCKESPSAPASVRGARNTPCLNNPGVRAATPAACLGLPEPVAGSSRATAATSRSGQDRSSPRAPRSTSSMHRSRRDRRVGRTCCSQTIGR